MSKIIGIDLGTTFSAVAHINDNGVPELIPNKDGDRLTPSVILYDDGEFNVGMDAKRSAVAFPEDIVAFIKLEMGKSITEFSREFGGKEYSPEDLSAEILKTLKDDAENALGGEITDAVITVPAYFNDPQRKTTIRAGEIAGLNVRRIINEPTAAALSYGTHLSGSQSRILVFDLGGGTFDVTIMEVKGEEMNVLVTGGDHRLGGKDWDEKIINHVAEHFEMEHGANPTTDPSASCDLRQRAVDAKIALSALSSTTLNINYAGRALRFQLTREEFEAMTTDLVERCRSLVDVVLHEKKMTTAQIDTVLLVGGSTRMPMIKDMIEEHFGKPPQVSGSPDETVALGAALMGELIEPEPRRFLPGQVRDRTVGIQRFSDVCSHSLGMAVLSESGELRNSTIIPKNTNIPCDVSKDDYKTTVPNQKEFDVIVLQGPEDFSPRECEVRDAYEVSGIPEYPAGAPIKVTFKYNVDGTIEVAAEDVHSKKVLSVELKAGDIDWDALVAPEPVSIPMDIALVIDCSGSMNRGRKLHNAKKAAIRFLDDIDPSFRVGLVSFQNRATVEMTLTEDFRELSRKINALNAGGGNNDEEAIAFAQDRVLADSQNIKVLVLLADGRPAYRDAMLREAARAKRQDIQMITIGVGNDVDSDLLKQVASTPENYYFVEESVQLESTFTTIASRLVTESSGRTTGITKH